MQRVSAPPACDNTTVQKAALAKRSAATAGRRGSLGRSTTGGATWGGEQQKSRGARGSIRGGVGADGGGGERRELDTLDCPAPDAREAGSGDAADRQRLRGAPNRPGCAVQRGARSAQTGCSRQLAQRRTRGGTCVVIKKCIISCEQLWLRMQRAERWTAAQGGRRRGIHALRSQVRLGARAGIDSVVIIES